MFGTEFLLHLMTHLIHATVYIRAGSRNVSVSSNGMNADLSVPAFYVGEASLIVDGEVRHFIKNTFTITYKKT